MRNPDDYRPCVGIMLLNPDRQVFVAKRLDTPGDAWQMPQGGVDPGEAPEKAAFRELEEEIGTANARLITTSCEQYYYDLPQSLQGTLWGGRYIGQRQQWFVMEYLGQDSDIRLDTETPEFSDWQWIAPQKLPELIVPFKRNLYTALLQEFREWVE